MGKCAKSNDWAAQSLEAYYINTLSSAKGNRAPHPCRFFERKQSRKGWDSAERQRYFQPITGQLLVGLHAGVVMTMVMAVVMVDYHYDLRLRRIGYREAEEKGDSEQNLFHTLV